MIRAALSVIVLVLSSGCLPNLNRPEPDVKPNVKPDVLPQPELSADWPVFDGGADGPLDRAIDAGPPPPGTWVTIAAGSFTMGSPATEPCREDNETEHQVTLTHPFEISDTEVTQAQYQQIKGINPSVHKPCGQQCPVENVSWHEAAAYCNALSATRHVDPCYTCTGSGVTTKCSEAAAYASVAIYKCPGYRLPTEAEWEYAYRAGTTTAYYSGPNDASRCDDCSPVDANLGPIAWYCFNSSGTSHPVAQKQANAWKLHDMAGNVWEWCHDWLQADLGAATVSDPVGPASGDDRVRRGGSFHPANEPRHARAANRKTLVTPDRADYIGFRCVRTK